jgi:anti-sigma factor RsiW
MILLAAGAGWSARGLADRPSSSSATAADSDFVSRAAIAHAVYTPEVRHPVEVDASHEDQLVNWLSKRLGAPMKAPHLQALGYSLEGGRLLPGDAGPVAQFMYRDAAGHRLTLYVAQDRTARAPANGSGTVTAFRFAQQGQVNVFYWVDEPFRYAITAASDRATLARVSQEVYRQLEPPAGS